MSKKIISVLVLVVTAVIIVLLVMDYSAGRPDRLGKNPYEYNVDEYRDVDPFLVGYRETRNYPVRGYIPGGIDLHAGLLWLTGDGTLEAFTPEGVREVHSGIEGTGTCIEVTDDAVYIGFEDHVEKYNLNGMLISRWEVPGTKCVFTSLAAGEDNLFVADAGNRRVLRYDFEGVLIGEFRGKADSDAGHGFIVPSANFDLAVNSYGELWVVNPGRHALENYTYDGSLRGFWKLSAMTIEGFSGCCNPAEMTMTDDGAFVTSEKSMVRIKIYDASGEMQTVVATPEMFREEGKAPEVVVDHELKVYALDFDRNMIRVFEPIK